MNKIIKRILVIIGIAITIILAFTVIKRFDLNFSNVALLFNPQGNQSQLITDIRHFGVVNGILLIALIALLQTIPGAPNSVICVLVGVCYGPWIGIVINIIGNAVGDLVIIAVLAKFGESSHATRSSRLREDISKMHHPLLGLTIGYMIPFIPSVLVNYTALEIKAQPIHILLAIIIGVIPASTLYAFGGHAIIKGNLKLAIIIILSVIALGALYYVIKLERKKRGTNA